MSNTTARFFIRMIWSMNFQVAYRLFIIMLDIDITAHVVNYRMLCISHTRYESTTKFQVYLMLTDVNDSIMLLHFCNILHQPSLSSYYVNKRDLGFHLVASFSVILRTKYHFAMLETHPNECSVFVQVFSKSSMCQLSDFDENMYSL